MKKITHKSITIQKNPAIMTVVIPSAKEGARIAATRNTSKADLVAFSHSLLEDASKRADEAFGRLASSIAR